MRLLILKATCQNLPQLLEEASSPIQDTISAEVHEYYLEPKPDFSRQTYVNIGKEQIDLHCNKNDDGEANDNFQATMDSFESKGDNQVAKSDNRQPERPQLPSVHDEIQYEDALSIYEVYTL